jgi:hypothetical protein
MSWSIVWSRVAERDLLALHWRLATRVDAAVMAFAAGRKHEGTIERISRTDASRLRLRLSGASALLWLDASERVVHVARVLRYR